MSFVSSLPPILLQFMRYVAIGGVAFVVDFAILLGLTEVLGWHYLLAATVGFIAGLAVNYLLAVRWVFDYRRLQSRRAEFVIFGLVGIAGLGLTNLLLYGMSDLMQLDYRVAKLITAAIVLAFNFSVRRALLFTKA